MRYTRHKKVCRFQVLVVLVAVAAVSCYAVVRSREMERQRAIVNEVRHLAETCKTMKPPRSLALEGKALVWDMASDSRSAAHGKLAAELRASSSDHPITVFLVMGERKVQVGTYSISRSPAYRQYMDIAVVSWPEKKAVGLASVVSQEPRSSRPVQYSAEYGDPSGPIADWIAALARGETWATHDAIANVQSESNTRASARPTPTTAVLEQRRTSLGALPAPDIPRLLRGESDRERSSGLPLPPAVPQSASAAHEPTATVVLTGVVGLTGRRKALLEITEASLGATTKKITLEEGERFGSVEVIEIDVDKGQVRIRNSGVEQSLSFGVRRAATVATSSPGSSPPVSPAAPPANWPPLFGDLNGDLEVRVKNPNDFSVRVALRSGGRGKDFTVAAYGTQSVNVPNGPYVIYFQYSHEPDAIYQGDNFTLNNNGAQITITKVVNGNYGIRKVN